MTGCPARADLQRLVSCELSADSSARLDRHIETCAACQKQLAEMTESADTHKWRQLLAESANGYHVAVTPPPPVEPSIVAPDIPGYRISREIGRGGAAVVYLARQTSLNRFVALKVLRTGSEPGTVQRFRAEAEAAAQLRHPNIVVVHEVGESNTCLYLAMEYLEAGTLAQATGRKPIPARAAAGLLEPVTRALEHAHRAGIIHRDIKPSNILLASGTTQNDDFTDWVPKVCDFGLARRLDEGAGLTRTHDLLGTPGYMAPELVTDAGSASPRSDVYALGIVLYEMLTGRPPFIGNTPLDTLLQVRDNEPVPPRRLQPVVPLDLQNVCLKCLHKDPTRRYGSASEFADDLTRFLAGQPVQARPISKLEHLSRWARRHRALAATLALLSFLLIAGTVTAFAAAGHFRTMAQDMSSLALAREGERIKAVEAREAAEHQRELTFRTLYLTRANLTGQSLQSLDSAQQIEQFFREWRGLRIRNDPRGWEWYYFNALNRRARLTLNGHEVDVLAVAWSPDQTRLASGGFDNQLRIWDPRTGRQLASGAGGWGIKAISWHPQGHLLAAACADNTIRIHDASTAEEKRKITGGESFVAWSSDGSRLAGFRGQTVVVWSADGAELIELAGHRAPPGGVVWRPDGQQLASADNSGRVCVWDPAKRTMVREFRDANSIIALRWSPDASFIACSHKPPKISLWDPAGTKIREWVGHSRSAYGLDFSPDSRTLATGSNDQTVKLWDVQTGLEKATLAGHSHHVAAVAFRPDGNWLASANAGWNGQVKLWRLDDPPHPKVVTLDARPESTIVWLPCGTRLSWADSTGIRLIDVDGRGEKLTVTAHAPMGFLSHDGQWCAGVDTTGQLAVWETATGGLVKRLVSVDRPIEQVAWSPDRRRLAVTNPSPDRKFRSRVRVFDVATGHQLHVSQAVGIAWSPDGRRLALGDSYKITVYNTDDFSPISTWLTPAFLNNQLRFSPDGKLLASVFHSSVVVLDASNGQVTFQLVGHHSDVRTVQWSPDGHRLATGAEDHTVRIWDRESGQLVLTLRGHQGPVWSLAWSPEGQRLAAIGAGGLCVWDARLGYDAERFGTPLRNAQWTADVQPLTFAGWWVTDEANWSPTSDPFTDSDQRPRWYAVADDPNGYLPLAGAQLVYLSRFFAPTQAGLRLTVRGPIGVNTWIDGQPNRPEGMTVTSGWHTIAIQLAEPGRQSDVIARPRAGFLVRLESN